MITNSKKNKAGFGNMQFLLMVFVWILIFSIPLLAGDNTNGIAWQHVFKIWTEYGFVFVVFLANHFLLFPQFLKGRRVLYFASIVAILAVLVWVSYVFNRAETPGLTHLRPPMEEPGIHPRPDDNPLSGPPHGRGPGEGFPPYGNLLIMSILIIGFDAGMAFANKWLNAEKNKIILEKENVKNQMAFLQNQVSPHFFMNTLNNIHALVDIDTEEAKEAIIRLSKMMGYMLYESQTEKISIQKEIGFIKSYVELMKLRFTNDVDVKLEIPETLPDINLPPLLTISFIENAFKHGVSYELPSFIHIRYAFKNNKLYFSIKNSDHARTTPVANSGIGLQNARKRLDLLYGNNYELQIDNNNKKEFIVNLILPV